MNYREMMGIDLFDLLHRLLLKWRSIMVCMLAGMILMGLYGYFRKAPMVVDSQGEKVTDVNALEDVSARNKLSYHEVNEVLMAVEIYLDYEKTYTDRKRLNETSVLLNCDAFHMHNCVTNYKISDYTNYNIPELSDVTNVDNIVELYKNYLTDQPVIDNIKKSNNWAYDDGFVRELITVEKTGLDIMTVSVIAPTKDESEIVMDILEKEIASKTADVQKHYVHDIKNIQRTVFMSYNSMILDQQKLNNDSLINIEKSMQQIPYYMNEKQKAYYVDLLEKINNEMVDIDGEEAGAIADKILLEESTFAINTHGEDTVAENGGNTAELSAKRISVKNLVMGALAGVFIIFCCYSTLYVFSPKLRTKSDMYAFGLSVLGEIRDDERYNKPFSGMDKFIDALFERKEGVLSGTEGMDIIASAICLSSIKYDTKRILITGAGMGKRLEDYKEDLMSRVEGSTDNNNSLSVIIGPSPLISSRSLKDLSCSDCVVLIEEVGNSRYEDIAKLMETCRRFGVNVIGTVVLS